MPGVCAPKPVPLPWQEKQFRGKSMTERQFLGQVDFNLTTHFLNSITKDSELQLCFSTLINKMEPSLFQSKFTSFTFILRHFCYCSMQMTCRSQASSHGVIDPQSQVLKYESICVVPSFPDFDWAQQGVSNRFLPERYEVIHGEVWVKNSEWSRWVCLKLHCMAAWPLLSILTPAAFFFSNRYFLQYSHCLHAFSSCPCLQVLGLL